MKQNFFLPQAFQKKGYFCVLVTKNLPNDDHVVILRHAGREGVAGGDQTAGLQVHLSQVATARGGEGCGKDWL